MTCVRRVDIDHCMTSSNDRVYTPSLRMLAVRYVALRRDLERQPGPLAIAIVYMAHVTRHVHYSLPKVTADVDVICMSWGKVLTDHEKLELNSRPNIN